MVPERIDAFCWPQSVAAGAAVALHASADGPVDVRVTRVDAADAPADSTTLELSGLPASRQVVDERAFEVGCADWPVTCELDTTGWRPGLHLVAVAPAAAAAAPAGGDGSTPSGDHATDVDPTGWAYVVVRASESSGRHVLMLATGTWNAYDDWGGLNLYTGATTVSFRRPLAAGFLRKPDGVGQRFAQLEPGARTLGEFRDFTEAHGFTTWHGAAGFATWEERFLRWAIGEGLAVDVVLDRDVHADPALLDGYEVAISVGHDEYTTWEQRDHLDALVARGGHLVVLGGNVHYWQVRHEGDAMVCFKHRYEEDPAFGDPDPDVARRLTTIWSDPLVGRPENELTGVSFTRGGYARMSSRVRSGSGGYTVHRPEHPLLEGTGLGWGDLIGADATVVGYECDGCDMTLVDGRPVPTGADGCPDGFEIVATSPAQPFDEGTTLAPLAPGGRYELEFHADRLLGAIDPATQARLANGHAVLGTWGHPSGGSVVTTGCTDWVHGLDDPIVARITRNALRLDGGAPTAAAPAVPAVRRFAGRTFTNRSFRGTTLRSCDVSGMTMRGVDLDGLDVDGHDLAFGTLLVNGVDVVPLVEAELDRRFPGRAAQRAQGLEELREGWDAVRAAWAETSSATPAELVHAHVEGEWSLAQTLRHLVLATDAWLRGGIEGREQPFHELGLVFTGAAEMGFDVSIFRTDEPTLDEILAVRAERQQLVTDFLADATPELLAEERANPWGGGDGWRPTVGDCVRVILEEEWAHLRYVRRDLALLA